MTKTLLSDRSAQTSTEFILVLAAVLAVAAIVIASLQLTSEEGSKLINKTAKAITKQIKNLKGGS